MLRRTTLALSLLLACAACDTRGDASLKRMSLDRAAQARLFLVPDAPRARVGDELRVAIHAGGDLASAPLATLLDELDPCSARAGGWQGNELVPQARDGVTALRVRFPEPGDAMIGFSTRGRIVDGALLIQHAKCMLPVTRDGNDLPAPSAVLSRRLGLAVELAPLLDPTALHEGDQLPLRVRCNEGRPAGAPITVSFRPRAGDAARTIMSTQADGAGNTSVRIGGLGLYLVEAVVEIAAENESAPRRVHRASLTFTIGEKP
jgi:uncharacterized protein DUF4198